MSSRGQRLHKNSSGKSFCFVHKHELYLELANISFCCKLSYIYFLEHNSRDVRGENLTLVSFIQKEKIIFIILSLQKFSVDFLYFIRVDAKYDYLSLRFFCRVVEICEKWVHIPLKRKKVKQKFMKNGHFSFYAILPLPSSGKSFLTTWNLTKKMILL